MRMVASDFQIFKLEPIDVLNIRVDFQSRECFWDDFMNISETLDMVIVDMHVSHHMHKLSSFQTGNLSQQTGQKGIASNIKRHP